MPVKFVVLNAALLAAMALAIVVVEALDRRDASVEAAVRQYAAAVTNSDLDGAMAEIAPEHRSAWRDFVAGQLGTRYVVTGVAVRAPSLLAAPFEVTTVMDIDPGDPESFYQPTTTVMVDQVDGAYYLGAPLLSVQ
jgi:hypothetical protein